MTTLISRVVSSHDTSEDSWDRAEERRKHQLARLRKAYASTSHDMRLDTVRRDRIAAMIREHSVPLNLVKVHSDTASVWQCLASDGAVNEWIRAGISVQVIHEAYGTTKGASTGTVAQSKDKRRRVVSLDQLKDAHGMPEVDRWLYAQGLVSRNESSLSVWQSAFREARLDSDEKLPESDHRARHYLTEEPHTPEAVAYRCLWEGSSRWIQQSPIGEHYAELVGPYVELAELDQDDGRTPRRTPKTRHQAPKIRTNGRDQRKLDNRPAKVRALAEMRGCTVHDK